MQGAPPLSCRQCGTVLSAAGGRCPTCGAEQPVDAARPGVAPLAAPLGAPPVAPPRMSRRGPPPSLSQRQKALPWVVLAVGLCAIGAVYAAWAPRHSDDAAVVPSTVKPPPAPIETAPADPNDLAIANPGAADPTEILGRAKTRALAWSKEAQLVAIRAEPVVDAKVNLSSGGSIEFWFAKPTGEGFGSGARVAGKRLSIKVAGTGTQVDEVAAPPGRAALEPNCPLDEAVKKATAAGLPASAALTVAYDISDKYRKAVWRLTPTSGGAPRTVDGWTCAILVR
jgi:hypothetical protein